MTSGMFFRQPGADRAAAMAAISMKMDEWFKNRFSALPQQLAHYTSVRKATQIITNKEVWLFNARTLNDDQEIEHALRIIAEHLQESNMGQAQDVGGIMQSLGSQQGSVFVFCLSEAPVIDNGRTYDRLSMWRAYGDDGNGVALYMRPDSIANAKMDGVGSLLLGKALYSEDEKLALIRDVVAACEDACGSGYDEKTVRVMLALSLWRIAPFMKHSSFDEECEWRAVLELTHSINADGTMNASTAIHFHDDGRPYVKVSLEPSPLGAFPGLLGNPGWRFCGAMIGPNRNKRVAAAMIASAFLTAEPEANLIAIEESQIPYRGRS